MSTDIDSTNITWTQKRIDRARERERKKERRNVLETRVNSLLRLSDGNQQYHNKLQEGNPEGIVID